MALGAADCSGVGKVDGRRRVLVTSIKDGRAAESDVGRGLQRREPHAGRLLAVKMRVLRLRLRLRRRRQRRGGWVLLLL